jgi:MFS family permease
MSEPGPTRPPLLFIFSITVTGILANTLVTAPLPDILSAFDEPDTMAGWVTAAATLPGILMAPVIGVLADRFGRRRVLVPCLVVFGLFGTAAAFAPSFGVLLACRFGQGFGSAGLINLAVVLIGDHWDGVERARLIGYNSAVLTVSVAVLPGVGGWLDQWGGWRWAFAPFALALGTAAVALKVVPDARPPEPPHLFHQIRSSVGVLRQPLVGTAIFGGFVLFALIFGLFLTVMPILLEDTYGLEPGIRGLALAVPALGSTLAALMLGRTRGRFGARHLLIGAFAMLAAGFGMIGVAGSLAVVYVGAFVYGLGEGSTIPTIQDLVAGGSPPASRGAVVALWVGAARAGQTTGPLLAASALGGMGASGAFLVAAAIAGVLLVLQVLSPSRWYATLEH